MTELQRAELLRDQVLKTWYPPMGGQCSMATVAQTAVMQTLAFVFGVEFMPKMTFEQAAAIDGGMSLMNSVLSFKETDPYRKSGEGE